MIFPIIPSMINPQDDFLHYIARQSLVPQDGERQRERLILADEHLAIKSIHKLEIWG